jgi:hypothetical protein
MGLEGERRIISERRMIQYIPGGIFRAFVKFCMRDKLREKMENEQLRGSTQRLSEIIPYRTE